MILQFLKQIIKKGKNCPESQIVKRAIQKTGERSKRETESKAKTEEDGFLFVFWDRVLYVVLSVLELNL